jgi:DNA-damage-inducible protein J
MAQDTVVRARIDSRTKKRAAALFAEQGLTLSDGIRMLLTLTVQSKGIPISLNAPNAETLKAIRDVDKGNTKKVKNIEELFKQLNA